MDIVMSNCQVGITWLDAPIKMQHWTRPLNHSLLLGKTVQNDSPIDRETIEVICNGRHWVGHVWQSIFMYIIYTCTKDMCIVWWIYIYKCSNNSIFCHGVLVLDCIVFLVVDVCPCSFGYQDLWVICGYWIFQFWAKRVIAHKTRYHEIWTKSIQFHGENGGTLGMVPLIINPIYTLHSGYLLGFLGYIPF